MPPTDSAVAVVDTKRSTAVTYSLRDEVVEHLLRNVDPKHDATFETHYTTFFIHFVHEQLLSGWKIASDNEPCEARGNAADALLLAYASALLTAAVIATLGDGRTFAMAQHGRCSLSDSP